MNKYKNTTRGFTLIELLTVIAVIGILAAIVVPAASKIQSMARVSTAVQDILQFKSIVADAASKLGGTLPITEGGTTMPSTTGTNLGTSTAANFYLHARLEQVLMGVRPTLLESYFRPSLGSQGFSRADSATTGELTFNSTTQRWVSLGTDTTIAATFSYATATRLECRTVNTAATPGVDGSNFFLNGGTTSLPAGRVTYIHYKDVPAGEAYNLALKLNGNSLMTDTTGSGTADQTTGPVTYDAPATATGVVDVFVYLAAF